MTNEMPDVTLNCDMGESFGIYKFGADERLMRIIDVANVACGFHGSDFNHMRTTIQLAKEAGVAANIKNATRPRPKRLSPGGGAENQHKECN